MPECHLVPLVDVLDQVLVRLRVDTLSRCRQFRFRAHGIPQDLVQLVLINLFPYGIFVLCRPFLQELSESVHGLEIPDLVPVSLHHV